MLNFSKGQGLIPAIIQDHRTKDVLMLGYMNQEAFDLTLTSKKVSFFSRSKNRIWVKGESSGNFLELISWKEDCDQDTLLIQAEPTGPVCHKGSQTCFGDTGEKGFIYELEDLIQSKMQEHPKDSYSAYLLRGPISKIAQKLGEEATETLIEAIKGDKPKFLEESADLLYHLLVLIRKLDLQFSDIEQVLLDRNRSS